MRRGSVPDDLAIVASASRDDLAQRWERAYGVQPPKGINRSLLERAAAWNSQAERFGGLPRHVKEALRPAVKRKAASAKADIVSELTSAGSDLEPISAGATDALPRSHEEPQLAPSRSLPRRHARAAVAAPLRAGSRLMREWNGRMHVVDVTADGMIFDGKRYRSLTAIARRITGTNWSGPRFFGLLDHA
jgi:hypothetical protein